MTLELRGISYTRDWNYESEWPTSFEHAVSSSIDDIAYSFREVGIEPKIGATQRIMGNLIEHLVQKGLMNNKEFQTVLEQNDYCPNFKLVEVEDNV